MSKHTYPVEILAHTLSQIKEQGVDIAKKNIHVQLDNASSTNKNGTVFAFMGACTQLGIVKSFTASFLRVGHTHEDTLQLFSLTVSETNSTHRV